MAPSGIDASSAAASAQQKPGKRPAWVNFAMGAGAALSGWVFVHPFDLLKVRAQLAAGSRVSILGMAQTIVKTEVCLFVDVCLCAWMCVCLCMCVCVRASSSPHVNITQRCILQWALCLCLCLYFCLSLSVSVSISVTIIQPRHP